MYMNQYSILIADDEKSLLSALSGILSAEGFHIIECVNGQEVVLKGLAQKPNLLFLDVQMPQMDGLAALKEIRENGGQWGKDVPAVFLTNIGDTQNIMGALDLHAQDYLIKSDIDLKDVVKLAKQKLNIK